MKSLYLSGARALSIALLSLGLAACGGEQEVAKTFDPVAFHPDDECHVCGMIIEEYPGPKGQAVIDKQARKFCSVAEMFGWYLQPENQHQNFTLYVHDMQHGSWDEPSNEHLIDAKQAYFVVATTLQGAMGAALASFADEQAAQQFAAEQGSQVLRFADIDQALLQSAAGTMHGMSQGMSHGMQHH
ncbi:MAG TPA: nitrous oxide reductase accessory protein NosL [Pseudomonas sp.]|jgi:copper chaperone NosL|uniref:nitrous oxide reductase accessory protein NosL n=1 Tax=Pseudomonas sp. TaxID=306 RepID=UPI002D10A1FE|nr:nitrous oxide reductase accessory protein NosL [Pseudomonas sp.]HTO17929.1 nitrous oxide reductase accessory protein NosL [Pseudomonas sp.]